MSARFVRGPRMPSTAPAAKPAALSLCCELVGLGIAPLSDTFSLRQAWRRNLGVRLEWQRYTDFGGGALGGVSDQDVIGVSAIYRFH